MCSMFSQHESQHGPYELFFYKRVCFGGLEPQGVSYELEENFTPASQGEKQFPVTFEVRSLGWMLNTLWGSLEGQ